jgi:hypothetical protein
MSCPTQKMYLFPDYHNFCYLMSNFQLMPLLVLQISQCYLHELIYDDSREILRDSRCGNDIMNYVRTFWNKNAGDYEDINESKINHIYLNFYHGSVTITLGEATDIVGYLDRMIDIVKSETG